MPRNIYCIICFFLVSFYAYSDNVNVSFYSGISITDTKLIYTYSWEEDEPVHEEYDVTWEKINRISYINFNYTGNFLGEGIQHGQKKYLILYGKDYVFFYDENNVMVFYQFSRAAGVYENPYTAEATSELKEKNYVYEAGNLANIKNLKPWVEGVDGHGQGEKIILKQDTTRIIAHPDTLAAYRYSGVTISNGFIDFNRPHLYEDNNRIKKIRISRGSDKNYIEVELEDTPQFQYFYFQDNLTTESDILVIEILEVYKGSKWDDTAINLIIPWGINSLY